MVQDVVTYLTIGATVLHIVYLCRELFGPLVRR
jgi:hypothetical protein